MPQSEKLHVGGRSPVLHAKVQLRRFRRRLLTPGTKDIAWVISQLGQVHGAIPKSLKDDILKQLSLELIAQGSNRDMRLRILNLGISARHALITALGSYNEAVSLSDFDAFAFDPNHVTQNPDAFFRRQREIRDLVVGKGGVLICILQPSIPLNL